MSEPLGERPKKSVRLEPDQPLEIAQVSDGAVESEPDDESDIDKPQPDEDIDN